MLPGAQGGHLQPKRFAATLCDYTGACFERCLGLLGIEAPEKM